MDEDGYFGEPVAARYDQSVADMSGPDVVNPAVDFLAELAALARQPRRELRDGIEVRYVRYVSPPRSRSTVVRSARGSSARRSAMKPMAYAAISNIEA